MCQRNGALRSTESAVHRDEHGVLDVAARELEVGSEAIRRDVRRTEKARRQVRLPEPASQGDARDLEDRSKKETAVDRFVEELGEVGGEDDYAIEALHRRKDGWR